MNISRKKKYASTLTIDTTPEHFDEAKEFIENALKIEKIDSQHILETLLIFEELFIKICDDEFCQKDDKRLTITIRKKLGEIRVLLDFKGNRFDIDCDLDAASNDSGVAILSRYQDRIGRRFMKRTNSISILARRSNNAGIYCTIAFVAAFLTYVVLDLCLSPDTMMQLSDRVYLTNNFLDITEQFFGNAMLMIAAPVTFFSLVTNITTVSVIGSQRIDLNRLIIKIVRMAFVAILAALVYFFLANNFIKWISYKTMVFDVVGELNSETLTNNIASIIPRDLFSAFTSISPLPLLFLGIFTAVAIISMNKHFFTIKTITDSLYTLFTRMLSIIMLFLPLIVYCSFLDSLLENGYRLILYIGFLILLSAIGILIMFACKCLVITFKGGSLLYFIKACLPAISKNFVINSSIDAIQYNIRFCNRVLKVRNEILTVDIPVLAQISLSGNCFILMFFTLVCMMGASVPFSASNLIILSISVVAMSLSAPNQPGSFFLGMIIILNYLSIPLMSVSMVFFMEAVVGRFLSLLNSFGDIVTVYCTELDEQAAEAAARRAENSGSGD